MKRSSLLALTVVVAIILVVAVILLHVYQTRCVHKTRRLVLKGSFFVSDAGRSHGGFEYNAEWNATLTIEDESATGTLELVLNIGLGDALKKHEYDVTDFTMEPSSHVSPNTISMKIESQEVRLPWTDKDVVWNGAYDRHYIASWGGDASPDEIRGAISPTIFPGLASHYYVELRFGQQIITIE